LTYSEAAIFNETWQIETVRPPIHGVQREFQEKPMKSLALLVGLGAMALCQVAHAQNILSSYSLAGTVTASTASYDYRYTKHTISAGGRGGHSSTYYSWDPYRDQSTTMGLPLQFGPTQSVTSTGTFYGPTYSATATASTSLTNTPTKAVLTVNYTGATTVTTALGSHQSVVVTALPGGTFTFTITGYANVTVSTNGYPGGVFRLFGNGGVVLGPLYGTSGPFWLDNPLPPGTYRVTNSLTYTSGINTQLGTSTNPGSTSTSWGFTMTITPSGSDGGGGD
jgi:hypothetical protein